jgi:hypothetical protein
MQSVEKNFTGRVRKSTAQDFFGSSLELIARQFHELCDGAEPHQMISRSKRVAAVAEATQMRASMHTDAELKGIEKALHMCWRRSGRFSAAYATNRCVAMREDLREPQRQ